MTTQCQAMLKSGPNKGQQCPNNATIGTSCGRHRIKSASSGETTIPTQTLEITFQPDAKQKRLYFVEVCAGAGGLSTGLIKAGFQSVLLNDIDKDCCETLTRNHREIKISCCSFSNIDWSPFIDKIDMVVAGLACQSWSQAGKREGADCENGDLFRHFHIIVQMIRPKVFLIENVKGLLTHKTEQGQKSFDMLLNILSIGGLYDIHYQVLNSNDYGVPQNRERIFIIGVLKSLNKSYRFPRPLETPKPVLGDVLSIPTNEMIGSKYSQEKVELFKLIPQGGNWRNLDENLQKSYLKGCYDSGGGRTGILYRCAMDKPSPTILCSPSQKQTERCHPLEERPFTIRESARIQTFPDDYKFAGSTTSIYRQIGNAVPVELAYHIGLSIFRFLSNSGKPTEVQPIVKIPEGNEETKE